MSDAGGFVPLAPDSIWMQWSREERKHFKLLGRQNLVKRKSPGPGQSHRGWMWAATWMKRKADGDQWCASGALAA